MSSYFRPNMSTFNCAAALAQGRVVKAGADDKHVVVSAAATDKHKGIAQSVTVNAEDPVEVALPGGGGLGLLGGVVSDGDFLTSDGAGALVTTTTPSDIVVAQAMKAGVSGDLIPLIVLIFRY